MDISITAAVDSVTHLLDDIIFVNANESVCLNNL